MIAPSAPQPEIRHIWARATISTNMRDIHADNPCLAQHAPTLRILNPLSEKYPHLSIFTHKNATYGHILSE